MTYCTIDQVKALTGTGVADATITTLITECDREINLLLSQYGLSAGSGDTLTVAAERMMKALLIEQGLISGDLGSSIGDVSTSGRGIQDAGYYRQLAERAVAIYAKQNPNTATRVRIRQMNRT